MATVINHKQFFTLGDPVSRSAFRVSGDHGANSWSLFFSASRGQALEVPLQVSYSSGSILRDFIWTTGVFPLISERVKQLFESNLVSGWSTYPVVVLDRNGQRILGYFGLSVDGRSGPVEFDRSPNAVIQREVPSGAKCRYVRGLVFDQGSWDGSDIFANDKTGWILVTGKVTDLFKKYKVTNCRLTPIEEVEMLSSDLSPATA